MRPIQLLTCSVLAAAVFLGGCDGGEEPEPQTEGSTPPGMEGQGMDPQGQGPQGQGMNPQGQGMDPEMMELMMEMQTIQQEIAPVQQQALEDDEIADQLTTVQAQVEAAMREEDPELLERVEAFESEVAEAQQAGDEERLQTLGQEAQELQASMQALETTVFERPEIQEPVEAFEAAHRERMIEIDPEVEDLLDRADEIRETLQSSGATPN